jgi:hypothetical protein
MGMRKSDREPALKIKEEEKMEIGHQKLLWVALVLVLATFPAEANINLAATTYGHGDVNVKQEDVHYGMLRESSSPPPSPVRNRVPSPPPPPHRHRHRHRPPPPLS